MTEEIKNPLTGCFVDEQVKVDEDSEEEGGADDIQWMGYKDVTATSKGKSFIKFEKPQAVAGSLFDLTTGLRKNVFGCLHLKDPWWEITLLRTKKARGYKQSVYPSDKYALKYKLRDDPRVIKDNLVHLYFSKLQNGVKNADKHIYSQGLNVFYQYLREKDLYDSLSLFNMEERVMEMSETIPQEDQSEAFKSFKFTALCSDEFRKIEIGQSHPDLLQYLPQLFPHQFLSFLQLHPDRLDQLSEMIETDPGLLAFKPIVSRRCGLLGCETTREALERSGLIEKVPQVQQEALIMYEFVKDDTTRNGHTCSSYDYMMDKISNSICMWDEAHDFLEKNKVTKTVVESGKRYLYLMTLWKCENMIAKEINNLVEENRDTPWQLDVNWDDEKFNSIREDADQWRAAHLIANQAVVAISGKGGCGKTHVVTTVITSAMRNSKKNFNCEKDVTEKNKINETLETDDVTQEKDDVCEQSTLNTCNDKILKKKEQPKINLLLTAPTGKAANLLGKRARFRAYTLHQIIFSFRHLEAGKPWKHEDTNVLVVDECSLVSVSTFSFLIQLLRENADLKRIILLGDVRQLPSIEPGNFLDDVFQSLDRIRCAVELRNNHRAESQIIVDNATRISKRIYPHFHPEKFQLCAVPDQQGHGKQDCIQIVQRLLTHEALKNHSTSQIISFTRDNCEAFNDICCKRYNDHRIKEKTKWVFRTGDKICCTKNGYVTLFEETIEGRMVSIKIPKPGSSGENMDEPIDDTQTLPMATDATPGTSSSFNESSSAAGSPSKSGVKKEEKEEEKKKRFCNGEIFFIIREEEQKDESNTSHTYYWLCETDTNLEERLKLEKKGPWKRSDKTDGEKQEGEQKKNEEDEGAEEEEEESKLPVFCVEKRELRSICKIRHAWARTIHTFQGSETESVVYIVGGPNRHQNWQHVYTAITRGKKNVFIVGQERILREVIKTMDRKRKTSLRKQLTEMLQIGRSQSSHVQMNNTAALKDNSMLPNNHSTQQAVLTSRTLSSYKNRDSRIDSNKDTKEKAVAKYLGGANKVVALEPTLLDTWLNTDKNRRMDEPSDHKDQSPIIMHNILQASPSTSIGTPNNTQRISPINVSNNAQVSKRFSDFHIRTGMSPLSPGFDVSPPVNRLQLRRGLHSTLDSSTPCSRNTQHLNANETELEDPFANEIIEPKCNQSEGSEWSEADESEYLSVPDSINSSVQTLNQSTPNLKPQRSGISRSGSSSLCTGTVNQLHVTTTKKLGASLRNVTSVQYTSITDGNNSQWSEVDESQYFGLDLEDIEAMNKKAEGLGNGSMNGATSSDIQVLETSPRNTSVDVEELESPQQSRPVIPLSSPYKRQMSGNARNVPHSPAKQAKREAETGLMSPLKNSLAKLGL